MFWVQNNFSIGSHFFKGFGQSALFAPPAPPEHSFDVISGGFGGFAPNMGLTSANERLHRGAFYAEASYSKEQKARRAVALVE